VPAVRRTPEALALTAPVPIGLHRVTVYALLGAFALLYLVPALIVISSAFRTPADVAQHGRLSLPRSLDLAAWGHVWMRACVSGTCEGIRGNFWNSLAITVPATLTTTALGILNGYILSKWRFRGADTVFLLMLLGVFLPPQVTLLPWAWTLGTLNLTNTLAGLVLVHTVTGLAFTTLFARNFFAAIPDDLVQAARLDGAGFWRIFRRIILPLARPIIAVCLIWQFTMVWNEFLFGIAFSTGTRQPVTAALQSFGVGNSAIAVLIAAGPPLLVFLLAGRHVVRGLSRGALR
jgi:glucose/mannose transport system permease protein